MQHNTIKFEEWLSNALEEAKEDLKESCWNDYKSAQVRYTTLLKVKHKYEQESLS